MSIASEIIRLQQAKSDLATSITAKGVTVPASATLDDYPALVDSIQTGGGGLPYDEELGYIETDGSVLIDTGVYPTSLNLTIEYTTMNNMLFGWLYNNQVNNTWICSSGSKVFWKNYNSSYNYNVPGYNDGTWSTYKYAMQGGFYKNNSLIKSFTASLGNSQINTIPLYLGNNYDRNAGTYRVAANAYNVKIRMCKIYSGSSLVRDYIPVRVGSVGYLYDKVEGKLYSGVGTGSFTLGTGTISLYDSEIEYIEGTGTQWINTGIQSLIGDSVSITVSTTSFGAGFLCGARANSSGMSNSFFIYGNVNGNVAFAANNSYTSSSINVQDGSIHTITHDATGGYIDNEKVVNITLSTAPSSRTYALFTVNDRDTPTSISSCKLYGFTYKRGSTTIMDLIPVRVGQVGYMYDRVSKQLFGNSGTGSFTLGPDVT